ncbi:MAG: hypothetical protein OXH08_12165 [Gammaproteobacteria bacterium]|nr:hypothetical protein [Gammaproteobacteria bacterium]MXW08427.1 hypothetical protein [Gammaproteobacteria bacterium]
MPRNLAQIPVEVWQKLASRRVNISPEALYDLIPAGVKTRTDDVLAFLGKRDLSHIESEHFRPDLANNPKNVLFEKWWWNRRRGSRNMKRWKVTRARLDNFAEGVVKGACDYCGSGPGGDRGRSDGTARYRASRELRLRQRHAA